MRQIGFTFLLLVSRFAGAAEATNVVNATALKVGAATVVERESKAQLQAKTRVLVVRDPVYRNERLSTSTENNTLLHLRLLDGTVLTLGPSSEMVLDDFAVNPKAGTAEVQVTLSRGLLRFVGGNHAGAGVRYRVKTPVATIGVRGTSFDLRVAESGETSVQLDEGELVLENESGDEVVIDDPNEASTVDESGGAPTEPEVDLELAAEFDELDLDPEQSAQDSLIEDELDDEEIEPIEAQDADSEEVAADDDSEDEDEDEDEDEVEDENDGRPSP